MSRWAPRVFQPTIQKDSVLVEWEVDAFPDSESPDTVIVELGKGGPRKFLDGDERSIELSAAELSPFAGITLAVNIGFQWDDGEEKWSRTHLHSCTRRWPSSSATTSARCSSSTNVS
jgi:hypothetical protein